MSDPFKDIFTKITLPDEIHQLAGDLVRLQSELLCKAQSSDDIFHLVAIKISSGTHVVCAHRHQVAPPFPLPAALIISFSVEASKYFLTSKLVALGGGYFEIDLAEQLFLLQRRQNYRVQIPDAYKTTVRLERGSERIKGQIIDLSGGGMKARIPVDKDKEYYRMGLFVTGQFELGLRPSIPFKAQIRHVKEDPSRNDELQIGLEFLDVPPPVQAKLFAITMELHREMFSKW